MTEVACEVLSEVELSLIEIAQEEIEALYGTGREEVKKQEDNGSDGLILEDNTNRTVVEISFLLVRW